MRRTNRIDFQLTTIYNISSIKIILEVATMKIELGLTSFADNSVIHMPEGSELLFQMHNELEI